MNPCIVCKSPLPQVCVCWTSEHEQSYYVCCRNCHIFTGEYPDEKQAKAMWDKLNPLKIIIDSSISITCKTCGVTYSEDENHLCNPKSTRYNLHEILNDPVKKARFITGATHFISALDNVMNREPYTVSKGYDDLLKEVAFLTNQTNDRKQQLDYLHKENQILKDNLAKQDLEISDLKRHVLYKETLLNKCKEEKENITANNWTERAKLKEELAEITAERDNLLSKQYNDNIYSKLASSQQKEILQLNEENKKLQDKILSALDRAMLAEKNQQLDLEHISFIKNQLDLFQDIYDNYHNVLLDAQIKLQSYAKTKV